MPCRCDVSDREVEAELVVDLLKYVCRCLNMDYDYLDKQDHYIKLDENTRYLCSLCRDIEDSSDSDILYDGRNATARKLADWWDTHKKIDYEREKEAKELAYVQKITDITLSVFNNAKVTHLHDRTAIVQVKVADNPEDNVNKLSTWLQLLRENKINQTFLKLELDFI